MVVDEQASDAEAQLLRRLRAGDEEAFAALVERHHDAMLRVARRHVRDAQAAEEVVQETWLIVLAGLDGFEARSTLRTWIFRILSNRAKTRGEREARTLPFSTLPRSETEDEAGVDRWCVRGSGGRRPGHRVTAPPLFHQPADDCLVATETLEHLHAAIDRLPPAQRTIIRLRDVEGRPATEVCALMQLSQGNQRVLLHRARSKVRAALNAYLQPEHAT